MLYQSMHWAQILAALVEMATTTCIQLHLLLCPRKTHPIGDGGRDGNTNMYPIAFFVVPKEDTTNW
jgi:hypothetical protein